MNTENNFTFRGRVISIEQKATKKDTPFFLVWIRQDGQGRYGPTITDLKVTYWHQSMPPGVRRYSEVICRGNITSYVFGDKKATFNDHEAEEFETVDPDDFGQRDPAMTDEELDRRADAAPAPDPFAGASLDDDDLPF